MSTIRELEIKVGQTKISRYDLNNKVLSLRGRAGIGKSSLISLIYLLLGSESTFSTDGNNTFRIFENQNRFNIPTGSHFKIFLKSGDLESTHELRIDDDGANFYLNGEKVKLDRLRKNYDNMNSTVEIADFAHDGEAVSFTTYNIDSFFRAFQKENGKIFTPSTKVEAINRKITKLLLGTSQEFMHLLFSKEKLLLEQAKLKKIKNKMSYLANELSFLNAEWETANLAFSSQEEFDNIEKLNLKRNALQNTRMYYKFAASDLQSQIISESAYKDYFKMIDRLKFKNDDLRLSFKNFLVNKIKTEINTVKTIAEINKKIKSVDSEIDKVNKKMELQVVEKSSLDKIKYIENRKNYVEREIHSYEFDEKYFLKISNQLDTINLKLQEISKKNLFLEKANLLLKQWNSLSGKYVDISNDFSLTREDPKISTTEKYIDKIIAFIVAIENSTYLIDEGMKPNIISANTLIADMNEVDKDDFNAVMNNFAKNIVDLAKKGITIILQDKHNQLNNPEIIVIDFDKENPFNCKKID